jgi:hypothetical protein
MTMMKTTAKQALTKALPALKGDGSQYSKERRAHVTGLLASDHLDDGYQLEVESSLEGDDLAEAVLSAFPSLGHTEIPRR